jgi:hypothetical protein
MGFSAMWGTMTDREVDRLPSLHRFVREPIEKTIVKFSTWCNLSMSADMTSLTLKQEFALFERL